MLTRIQESRKLNAEEPQVTGPRGSGGSGMTIPINYSYIISYPFSDVAIYQWHIVLWARVSSVSGHSSIREKKKKLTDQRISVFVTHAY